MFENRRKAVWVQSGGVGWSPGYVVGERVNRKGVRILRVVYARAVGHGTRCEALACFGRIGERTIEQVRDRRPSRMGGDKPATRGRERRRSCCTTLTDTAHYSWCPLNEATAQPALAEVSL